MNRSSRATAAQVAVRLSSQDEAWPAPQATSSVTCGAGAACTAARRAAGASAIWVVNTAALITRRLSTCASASQDRSGAYVRQAAARASPAGARSPSTAASSVSAAIGRPPSSVTASVSQTA